MTEKRHFCQRASFGQQEQGSVQPKYKQLSETQIALQQEQVQMLAAQTSISLPQTEECLQMMKMFALLSNPGLFIIISALQVELERFIEKKKVQ